MSMFEPYYSLLPPHWRYNDDAGTYYNEITREESNHHPITIFMNSRQGIINPPPNDLISIEIERLQNEALSQTKPSSALPVVEEIIIKEKQLDHDDPDPSSEKHNECTDQKDNIEVSQVLSGPNLEREVVDQMSNVESIPELELPTGKFYEFHCQWSERDLFGKVSLYGLTFRYYAESHKTLIRFDGLVGEWVYSVLQGPYGPLEHIDFFIGAKIRVFGRQVTISSASGTAIRWIEAQRKRLEKQQERFREKIMAVGQVPCVKLKQKDIVRHITRGDTIIPGHTDLRRLLLLNAKLGEQLVSLGLSDQL